MKTPIEITKIVDWSEEDQCYIGRCPSLMAGGVHGIDEVEVAHELDEVIEEWLQIFQEDNVQFANDYRIIESKK